MLLYRLLTTLFAAVVLGRLVLGRSFGDLRARLALGPAEPGHHLWLHAASNGELASARPLIEALRIARPDLALVVTCNSVTGVALAQSWGLPARLAPLDLGWVTRRFLRNWSVRAHLAMESELWPHRVLGCPGPVLIMGGRLSERTARAWRLFGGLQRRLLARIHWLSAQDEGSLARYLAAGLPADAAGPVVDLKALYDPPDLHDATLSGLNRDHTWLAASTHEGEEATALTAHLVARAQEPELRLILAPRHPRRADDIVRLANAKGLTVARRSLGEAPDADVYLADTLGEMALFYAAAGRVFIGGTLADRGGHTPYEPAACGAALIHGPDVRNFRAPFARLDAAGAACAIDSAETLAAALLALHPRQRAMGQAARALLRPRMDAQALVAGISARLDTLTPA
ncbi:3-deoxy-D-manno-octulosonic acid transferase [Salipiger aestuarii]|uniref:3-deoxy-D-manno-octulosonic acid transferase n=1 Tax=Salipiger aestuarii TaxID=568098 RepID=A0A327YM82_9RHOB|nr:glycosyltransferase N-terminal domain-containing protein [Salipiger aestuarii]EIE50451.1 3-deoxy-D-manno-octulosonic-acid transferase domain-containing protein [Citreicella sp. 357]KAA8609286.1 3-deoxy-D-manno-octulosonic acid transferase [Salipiger aestuarii]KAB2542898.1 3-deoxy-D-manno-octulosonic acid transferase [Salipiger aestuarii]RAK20815.1 3-deoxy-D-manno-octulosonic-acid transferase [Salipiger aestuarii]